MRKNLGGIGRILTTVVSTVLMSGLFLGSAHAVPLLNTNSVTAGGVLFTLTDCKLDSVTCVGVEGDFAAWAGHGAAIKITGITGGDLLSAGPGVLAPETHDLTLLFDVTGSSMKKVTATMNGSFSGQGFGTVDELITSNPAAVAELLGLSVSSGLTVLSDSTPILAPQSELFLDKDIFVAGPASIAYVTESVNVPEPSGLGLLLLASTGVVALRRRGSKARGADKAS